MTGRYGVNPRYEPAAPPGLVFISNHGAFDGETKKNHDEASIAELAARLIGIPSSEVVVLRDCVPGMPFSSFAPECYSEAIKAKWQYLSLMIDLLKQVEEET